jgi:hypothetical protein
MIHFSSHSSCFMAVQSRRFNEVDKSTSFFFNFLDQRSMSGMRLLDYYRTSLKGFTTRNPRFIRELYKENTEPLTSPQEAAVLSVLQERLSPHKISAMIDRMDSGIIFHSNQF